MYIILSAKFDSIPSTVATDAKIQVHTKMRSEKISHKAIFYESKAVGSNANRRFAKAIKKILYNTFRRQNPFAIIMTLVLNI